MDGEEVQAQVVNFWEMELGVIPINIWMVYWGLLGATLGYNKNEEGVFLASIGAAMMLGGLLQLLGFGNRFFGRNVLMIRVHVDVICLLFLLSFLHFIFFVPSNVNLTFGTWFLAVTTALVIIKLLI